MVLHFGRVCITNHASNRGKLVPPATRKLTMRKCILWVGRITVICFLGVHVVYAQKLGEKEKAELAKALPSAKISLERALLVSEREGKPVSAGFELDNGELNLWVFVKKG